MRTSLLAVLAATTLAAPAAATSSPPCPPEPRGDQRVPADEAMDLLPSAYGISRTSVVFAIRVARFDEQPVSATYRAVIAAPGGPEHTVAAYLDVTGEHYGTAAGKADRARNELRINVRRSDLPAHLRPLRGWRVRYESARGPAPATIVMDTAGC